MACVDSNLCPTQDDSEREEGEIVDELDELSDISSEEEYLLRQRLQVLENYNNVLERKEAKRTSSSSGNKTNKVAETLDLSDVSVTNFEDSVFSPGGKVSKSKPIHHKHRRRKEAENNLKYKEHKKKPHKTKKRVEPLKAVSETSDEEDYEYRNKRRKLANAVSVNKVKADTSLRSRLTKMIANSESYVSLESRAEHEEPNIARSKEFSSENNLSPVLSNNAKGHKVNTETETEYSKEKSELINISTDDDVEIVNVIEANDKAVAEPGLSIVENNKHGKPEEGSDEDLEALRQYALKSKAAKAQESEQKSEEVELNRLLSEDDDDAELRLICLRSAFLKKAIEHKQKQKLEKKLSQSTSLYDEIIAGDIDLAIKSDIDNNTDIESMDMDIGSDNENKEHLANSNSKAVLDQENHKANKMAAPKKDNIMSNQKNIPKEKKSSREEDIDEDEDLLRAKLLTSLSKNLPLLLDTGTNDTPKDLNSDEKSAPSTKETEKAVNETKFIINTGDSDSEGEHEATKNLTKMHIKLSEQIDFQQKLDMFLKSARSEVEKTKLPDVVQQPAILPVPVTPQKFVPKAVNHLPKSEQIEYKNLVRRMVELEKVKQARQVPLPAALKPTVNVKDTLKPRNVSIDNTKLQQINHLDEQIAMSRKKIAEESAKVLQLREQETKLSQKYKIVATELRNLTTAIGLNKRQQKSAQIRLSKMRGQHQLLLKRSTIYSRTSANNVLRQVNKSLPTIKSQKENAPVEKDINEVLKSVKVSVVNDFKEKRPLQNTEPMLSVQIDVTSNRKTVTLEDEEISKLCEDVERRLSSAKPDDYKSPLDALTSEGWNEDPNGVLCPFEVGGNCKDTNCKYLHPKAPTH